MVGIAVAKTIGVGIALLGIASLLTWNITITVHSSKEAAQHAAEVKASNIAKVQQCYDNERSQPGVKKILQAISVVAQNQIDHLSLDQRDRHATIDALAQIQRFEIVLRYTTPTLKDCQKLAARLGVAR